MLTYRRGPLAGPYIHALSHTKFETKVPFTVENLRRLAPAAEASKSAIVYNILPAGPPWTGQSIEGLLHLGQYDWDLLRGNVASLDAINSTCVIRVSGPGDITVAIGRRILARLREGRIVRTTVKPFSAPILNAIFDKAVDRLATPTPWDRKGDRLPDSGHLRSSIQKWLYSALDTLLADIKRLRHGGTVLIIPSPPDSLVGWNPDWLKIRYRSNGTSNLTSGVFFASQQQVLWDWTRRNLNRRQRKHKSTAQVWRRAQLAESKLNSYAGMLRDGVREIAGFSTVDGAVVLTDEMLVMGWGAEIMVPDSIEMPEFEVIQGIEGRRRNTMTMASFGTRHRSAARYVSRVRNSIAVVVSQDGGAKLLANLDGRLVLWKDIETTQWLG